MSNRRHRWLAGAMAGFVALAAALSFAPKPIPAVPPPVRLEGALDTTTNPTQNELVVVPAPSIDLGGGGSATTTVVPAGPPTAVDDSPSQGSGTSDSVANDSEADDSEADDSEADDSEADDSDDGSADSIDDSADSADD
ncbi:MAG TPA: hypothetical protein VLA91_00060 [Acidimicrobiia bacterium]|nr:hypothetical protein [Acidimicrobiia bacterium]